MHETTCCASGAFSFSLLVDSDVFLQDGLLQHLKNLLNTHPAASFMYMHMLTLEGCETDRAGTRLDHTNSTLSAGELSCSQRIKVTHNPTRAQSTPGTVAD